LILDLIDRGFLRFFRNNVCRGYRKKAMLPLDEYNACWSSDASSEN